MLTVHYSAMHNGQVAMSLPLAFTEDKPILNIPLPRGGSFKLTILPSASDMRPFGLQENHCVNGPETCEGSVFLFRGISNCCVSLVSDDSTTFVAISTEHVPLPKLIEDFTTGQHMLAEYIPITHAALAA